MPAPEIRAAAIADAGVVASLLHDFNTEFETPSPGPALLAERLGNLLGGDELIVLLSGEPPVALALMTFRPGVWDAGPYALLEELYVRPDLRSRGIGGALLERSIEVARERASETFEINVDEGDTDAQRFYRAHGFTDLEPDTGERAFYFHRRIAGS